MLSPSDENPRRLSVMDGGRETLSGEQRRALSCLADLVRELSPGQVQALVQLVEEFQRDGYLERLQPMEIPAVKILAEVINGWEPDGVYEFARAWASTLVARQDGFCWDSCSEDERDQHRRRVLDELSRRGY